MKLQLPERHLQPSQRLQILVALLACLSSLGLWPLLHRGAAFVWLAWAPVFVLAVRYVSGSWVRVSPVRGLSWCLRTPFGTRLGNVELTAADIAEIRVEARLLSRLVGLTDLIVLRRDGRPVPPFRFFEGMEGLAEELHGFLQQ